MSLLKSDEDLRLENLRLLAQATELLRDFPHKVTVFATRRHWPETNAALWCTEEFGPPLEVLLPPMDEIEMLYFTTEHEGGSGWSPRWGLCRYPFFNEARTETLDEVFHFRRMEDASLFRKQWEL